MADPPEIRTEQVEEFARAARATIERRLQQVPEGEGCDFWMLVARLYARGLAGEDTAGPAAGAPPAPAGSLRDLSAL